MFIPHITIYTATLEESVKFYSEVLHLQVVADQRPNAPIVFLANNKGETCVELILDPANAYNGGGIAIGFETSDVCAERTRMEALGLNPTPFISPNPRVKFFFIKDPNGVTVQLIQH